MGQPSSSGEPDIFEVCIIQVFTAAVERFRRHANVAWDGVYGGVFRNLQHVDQNIWNMDKVLWAQEEVLIGSLCTIEHTGADWAQELYTRMFRYVQDKFVLRRHGLPLWIFFADRKVTFEPHAARVENYHHPRHLMLNLLQSRPREREGRSNVGYFNGSCGDQRPACRTASIELWGNPCADHSPNPAQPEPNRISVMMPEWASNSRKNKTVLRISTIFCRSLRVSV